MNLFARKIGEGEPLLIVHGLFGSGDNWQTIGKSLSAYFTVYLVDLRNHGHSPHAAEHSFDLMAKDLAEFCVSHEITSANLIGHSMGGKVVLRLAQLFPEISNKIMSVDMGIKAYKPQHNAVFRALLSVDFEKVKIRKEVENTLSSELDTSTVGFLMKNLYWKESGRLDWRFNLQALYSNKNEMVQAIPQQHMPQWVLFARGENSDYLSDQDFQTAKLIIPNAEMVTIHDAGHWAHADNPTEFTDVALRFLLS